MELTGDCERFDTEVYTGRLSFSLVRDDLLFRAQRAIGLVPCTGFGVGRRSIFYALVAWLPIALPAHDHQNRDQR
jgi:hypothetical protein